MRSRTMRGLAAASLGALSLLACAPDAPAEGRDVANSAEPRSAATASPAAAGPSAERSPRRVTLAGVDLTGIGYDKGSPDAPIVIVDFSDFGCPYCGSHARQTLPELEREFIATGKVFYKYVPFVMGMFPNGDAAARAAECAAEQGRFWPMHDRLYEAQQEWKRSADPSTLFVGHARALGLEEGSYAACLADGRTNARTARASDVAKQLGIRATPTFAVDGEAIEGALPLNEFQRVLRAKAAR